MNFVASKYPTLIDKSKDYYPIAMYGVECGDGWIAVISEMLDRLAEINEKQENKFGILQIKEKFGGLRVYTTGLPPEEADAVIRAAEDKCSKTCYHCGAPARMITERGWYVVLCDKCIK